MTTEPFWLQGLNRQQRLAVESEADALLVRAGPGTGKTRVLTCRIANHIATGICPPEAVLAITFTNQAAMEMAERLGSMEGRGARGLSSVTASTFHSWAWRLLSRPAVVSEAEQLALIKDSMEEAGVKGRAQQFASAISLVKQQPEPDPQGLDQDSARIWALYHQRLRDFGLKDYDDLILDVLALLRPDERPDGQKEALSVPLPGHLFVDEFQDVSPAQFELVRLLYMRCGHVTVIGDENQAIYGFRGGSRASMDRFLSRFPGAEEIRLDTAYRCPQLILDAAQAVINGPGQGKAGLVSARKVPAKVERRLFKDDRQEAAWIAAAIERAVGALSFDAIDSGLSDGSSFRSLSDVAVLYRFNRMARPISKALEEAGIPFQSCERKSPLAQPELECLHHLLSLICLMSDKGLEGDALKGPEGFHLMQLSRRAKAPFARGAILKLDSIYRQAGSETFVRAALEAMGFPAPDRPLLEQAVRAVEMHKKGLPLPVCLRSEPDALGIETEAVTLMTIHAAKGREFPIVFLVGLEDGVLPWEKGDEEEERRLFYVAITRASEQLVITSAARRSAFGQGRLQPSSLLDPISSLIPEVKKAVKGQKKRRRKRQKSLF